MFKVLNLLLNYYIIIIVIVNYQYDSYYKQDHYNDIDIDDYDENSF
jgi:hypothetical protein